MLGAMPGIYVSIVIDAPVEEVWSVVEPVERHVDWMADAESIRFHGDQTRGVGTRFVCATKVGPIRLQDEMEITEWEAPRLMGVRHQGLVTGTGKFTLQRSVAGGTLFAWEEELHFPWWLGGPLGELVGGRLVLKQIWKRNLRALKREVESHRAAAAG
jgi:carbon monoxide dehydrogenase subunit G